MSKKWLFGVTMTLVLFLAGCDYSKEENRSGFFYNTFVSPMDNILHWLGDQLNNNYGLAIIALTLIVRLAIFPFMMRTYKNQMLMREKMKIVKPQMDDIQKRMKLATTQEEKMEVQQEMMGLYKKHDINPLNVGCLPMFIQMPIVMALFFALKYPSEGGIVEHPDFLWMNLTEVDYIMVVIAGIVYAVQAYVSTLFLPEEQKKQMRLFMFISPIMILWISFISPAALPLYWAVGGIFLIVQTIIGNVYYRTKVEEEMAPIIARHEEEQREKERKKKGVQVAPSKKRK
ncbi:membrane protein insertase YidC [Phocicoccus pinnipedialis]|uniref:Membrane protein insertase YidC n=1 Tax=Phocicoccus pinnipedialis TaxID=110845 RepID=A0A6V7R537_9BACL|nr:membrane protein insertase YidC [Jeotgalicoccus pinnipedialis]MBP1939924.1 YidC/Oxa1 family membrane protein insertase [Jeotgalicoccus pinnipedialis]CAD2072128.1 Membrane protein insertase YidC precursor [Jeotgalicoccus pinnipedialis]